MEDIILLETSISEPENQVFVLQFATGEFDMVTFDSKNIRCNLYEIKYSTEIAQYQYRHLVDSKKLEQTEKQYGKICERAVIYNGEKSNQDGIKYLNAEEYLLHMRWCEL